MYDPYAVLGLSPRADLPEIKKVFRNLAKTLHPDLRPDDPYAVPRFQEINRAYEMLVNMKTAPQGAAQYQSQYYYPPYQQQTPPPPPPTTAEDFKTYAWEPLDLEEDAQEVKVEVPPPPKEKRVEEAPQPIKINAPKQPWREDLTKACHEEAFRLAKNRALKKKYSPDDQLTQDIMIYLMRGKSKFR
ncbi:MAG: J domain-containing protein [Eubacteriales bacterium]